MQAQARAPTTIRPAAVDPLTAPRVVTLGQIPAVVARSATALRARPQTDVRSLGLLLFRTRQTRPSPFGCHGSGYRTFALNQDAPSAASYIVTVPPP